MLHHNCAMFVLIWLLTFIPRLYTAFLRMSLFYSGTSLDGIILNFFWTVLLIAFLFYILDKSPFIFWSGICHLCDCLDLWDFKIFFPSKFKENLWWYQPKSVVVTKHRSAYKWGERNDISYFNLRKCRYQIRILLFLF